MRKGYTYTRKDGKRVSVKPKCIVDRGAPGKGAKVLPKPRKGKLGAFGYSKVKSLSVAERHAALKKAVKYYGRDSVIGSLTLVANYNKKTNPRTAAIFRSDAKWVHREFPDQTMKQIKAQKGRKIPRA